MDVGGGTIALANNTANYVERTYAGVVQTNTTRFSKTAISMAIVRTLAGAITSVEDWRPELGPTKLYGVISGEVGVVDYSFPPGHAFRYGMLGDASSDNATTGQNWLDSCVTAKGSLKEFAAYLPAGRYKITAPLVINNTCLHIYGDGPNASVLTYDGVSGGCLVAASLNRARFQFNDFGISGGASSGIGIDLTAVNVVPDPQVELSRFERLIIESGEQAFRANSLYSSVLRDIYGSSIKNHAFHFQANICTTMQGLYAGVCGTDKAGYRIAGSVRMYGCNGVTTNDGYWGVFGSNTALTNGFQTDFSFTDYPDIHLMSCNLEGWSKGAVVVVNSFQNFIIDGGTISRALANDYHSTIHVWAQGLGSASTSIELNGVKALFSPVLVATGVGTITISGGAGVGTFSTSQAGVVAVGDYIEIDGASYLVSAFNGTTGVTLHGAPNVSGKSFNNVDLGIPMRDGVGTITITGGAGAGTFTVAQRGLLNGQTVAIGGVHYAITSLSGTSVVLAGAPDVTMAAFRISSYDVYSESGNNSIVLRNDLTGFTGIYLDSVPGVWPTITEGFRSDVYQEYARWTSAITSRRITAEVLRFKESTVANATAGPFDLDVTGYTLVHTANTVATTIRRITFTTGPGQDYQRNGFVFIFVDDDYTTFQHRFSFINGMSLLGARDYHAKKGDVLVFQRSDLYDGTYPGWVQTGGAFNAAARSAGTNPVAGTVTLVAGTATVSTDAATSTALVFLQRKTAGGTVGNTTWAVTAGTSFTVTSDNALDTSTYAWWIVQTF
jgi:hypothetical protein